MQSFRSAMTGTKAEPKRASHGLMQSFRSAMRVSKAEPKRAPPGLMQSFRRAMSSRPAPSKPAKCTRPAPRAPKRLMQSFRAALGGVRRRQEEKERAEQATREQTDAVEIDLDKMFDPITKDEQRRLMSLPQHFADGSTNPEWLKSRVGVMTGSKVSNVSGHGFDRRFLQHMVWPSTHTVCRKFCDYGLENEDRCEEVLASYLRRRVEDPNDVLDSFEIHHCGLVRHLSDRSRGYSPDGYVEERYTDGTSAVVLSEYKCPYSKRLTRRPRGAPALDVCREGVSPRVALYKRASVPPPRFPGAVVPSERKTLPIPPYYYDQVQWGMDIMMADGFLRTNPVHCPRMRCYFVVWTPKVSQLCEVPYHQGYARWLAGKARRFMQTKYLPAVVLKQNGLLDTGDVELTLCL